MYSNLLSFEISNPSLHSRTMIECQLFFILCSIMSRLGLYHTKNTLLFLLNKTYDKDTKIKRLGILYAYNHVANCPPERWWINQSTCHTLVVVDRCNVTQNERFQNTSINIKEISDNTRIQEYNFILLLANFAYYGPV